MSQLYDKLTKFDYVLAHTFKVMLGNQKGAVLPEFMEWEKFEKARQYVLQIYRDGYLDIIYNRIMEGKI